MGALLQMLGIAPQLDGTLPIDTQPNTPGLGMSQPSSAPAPQAEPAKSPFDTAMEGLISGMGPTKPIDPLEDPETFVKRRINESLYGSNQPTGKSKALAFLTSMLAGAAVGPKYIGPVERARQSAIQEYKLAQENQRSLIAEQRNQQMQFLGVLRQAQLDDANATKDKYQQQLVGIAKEKNAMAAQAEARKARRDDVLNAFTRSGMDVAQRQQKVREFVADKLNGDPNEMVLQAYQRVLQGNWTQGQFDAFKREYDKIFENQKALKAVQAPQRAARSFQRITDEEGNITGFYNPDTQEFAPPPYVGARSGATPGPIRERGALRRNLIEDMDKLEPLADKNRSSIGRAFGNIAAAKVWLVGAGNDVNTMFRLADNAKDSLLRARSGAQINEAEYARLSKLVPDPRGPEDVFFTNLREFRSELQRLGDKIEPSKAGAPGGAPAIVPPTGKTGPKRVPIR